MMSSDPRQMAALIKVRLAARDNQMGLAFLL